MPARTKGVPLRRNQSARGLPEVYLAKRATLLVGDRVRYSPEFLAQCVPLTATQKARHGTFLHFSSRARALIRWDGKIQPAYIALRFIEGPVTELAEKEKAADDEVTLTRGVREAQRKLSEGAGK
jgi:hypothetical protein